MEKRRREGEISFFVKDSLTRSFLASVELFHVKRGFTNLGQRRPSPSPSLSLSFSSFVHAASITPRPFFLLSFLLFSFISPPPPFLFLSSLSLFSFLIIVPEFLTSHLLLLSRLKSGDIWPTVISATDSRILPQ